MSDLLKEADLLVEGVFRYDSYPPVNVGKDVDWSMDPHDRSWKFALHNLNYVYTLLDAHRATSKASYLERAHELLESWAAHNIPEGQSDFSWDQHATALRAQVYARGAELWRDEWITDVLLAHGEFLSNPANYAGPWNHGLDEDLGLLAVGRALDRRDWVELAADRAGRAVGEMVDGQGATNEQAVGYHHYDWVLFKKLARSLRRSRLPIPSTLERRHAIPTFLAHATRPDGCWVGIGDSSARPAEIVPETPLEYAATQGASGNPPDERVKVFERGWVFGRTGWGVDRPFAEESYYSIRFGPGRLVHGHRDHTSLTYFAKGKELITEAGFGGYHKDGFRTYERLERAHNQVVVSGAGKFRWENPTELIKWRNERGWQWFDLYGRPYEAVERFRRVVFVEDPEMLLVQDLVTASREVTCRQLWHLSPDLAVAVNGRHVTAVDETRRLHVVQALPFRGISTSHGQTSPVQGWVARGRADRVPAPVLITRVVGKQARFLTIIALGGELSVERARDCLRVCIDKRSKVLPVVDGWVTAAT